MQAEKKALPIRADRSSGRYASSVLIANGGSVAYTLRAGPGPDCGHKTRLPHVTGCNATSLREIEGIRVTFRALLGTKYHSVGHYGLIYTAASLADGAATGILDTALTDWAGTGVIGEAGPRIAIIGCTELPTKTRERRRESGDRA